jgi:uncharacterized membrane protein/thiol-disulfide isomerase/thioredoxin
MIRFSQRILIAKILTGLLVLLTLFPIPAQAQTSVVYGVFFYSPTCPHCHEVITSHWPGIQDEFGDQLQVLFIDVTKLEGSQIMGTAIEAMRIPSNSVPMLIIGTEVLVGSIDIPQRAPGIIRAGLNSGGIGYPPIPGIDSIFQSALSNTPSTSADMAQRSLFDDPANIAALIVLLGLVAGIGMMGTAGWHLVTQRNRRRINPINGLLGRRMALIGTLVGIGLAGSLVIGSFENLTTLLISSSVLAAFVVLAVHLFRSTSVGQLASWLIPLIIVAGLLVAGYLAYVEMTLVEATCGVLGDCNAVQQSSYARILGIPVGIIGILGYITILSLWMVNRFRNQQWLNAALFVMALLGVGFSTYLTFLEPFVIGASCVWCLTSAVVMGILLWMTAPAGWDALRMMQRSDKYPRKPA